MDHQRYDRVKMTYSLPKANYINHVSAVSHLITVIATCVSLGGPTWFHFDGDICVLYLTLAQFFWFGYVPDGIDYTDSDCLGSTFIYSMRAIILLCFVTIISSLFGFWMDIIEYKHPVYLRIRKSPLTKLCSMSIILIIIGLCWCLRTLSKRLILTEDAKSDFDVSFGVGFYLVALSGGMLGITIIFHIIELKRLHHKQKDHVFFAALDAIQILSMVKSYQRLTRRAQNSLLSIAYKP
ncbi:hypothetical protein HUJ04_006079 [Dendroctonus ponderosae]|uniref:Transmembrane protein 127 transmembrane region domain-containing protein n=1 Tax=Dendroctonus ponderosae TaxID=77166 RepID=A0AAR5PQV1_DENPD|nr:hypothetical protein HUJ04_006079 [Dendroctonus ponderosae]